jgi:colicin import membrane protein
MHADAVRQRFDAGDDGFGRAVALAIAVHVLVALVLWLGAKISWNRAPLSVAGGPSIEATLDVSSADQRAVTRALEFTPEPLPEPVPEPEPLPQPIEEPAAPPPQPLPEPRPQDAPVPPQPQPQERVPDPAPVNQEEVRRDAERERARIEQEQEARRRQEQIELAERQRQEEAEQKRRQAQQQLERIRAERERAAREAREAQERMDRIAQREAQQASQQAASAPPPPGNQGVDSGLAARYAAALQEAILRNWTRPDSVPLGQRCRIVIRQIPGGTVTSAEVDPSCPYDELGRRSVEAAVLKAQPLPYAGYEPVFQRTLILNFSAQDR